MAKKSMIAREEKRKELVKKYAVKRLSRNKLREATMRGDVPGVVKASW